MSEYKVPYTTIRNIIPHPNAERLEIATIYGFQVIVQKDKYQVGSKIVYIPVDSILPAKLEAIVFPEGSKVKLHKSRVRQIRLRSLASQGMVLNPEDVASFINLEYVELETDLKDMLGVAKYEPPQPGFAQTLGKDKQRNKREDHPLFHKYNGLDNIKWFPDLFQEGEQVVIQEKLHGTNARASKLPFIANTFWKRVKKFLRMAPEFENCYGSNNVEISARSSYKGFYGEDIYGSTFQKIDVFNKLKPNETVFGEIIGPGIQKGYEYGLKEHDFVLFDVKIIQDGGTMRWLSPFEAEAYAEERGFKFVPILYKGPFNKELTYSMSKGPSTFDPSEKIREGAVVKARLDYDVEGNKKALKVINEDYLDIKDNTDFH